MSYIKHHCIIVTSYNYEKIDIAHAKAMEIFDGKQVSNLVQSAVNRLRSFFIGPDGSCEYGELSEIGDQRRHEFKIFLQNFCFEDGSSPMYWAEMTTHDEKADLQIIDTNSSIK